MSLRFCHGQGRIRIISKEDSIELVRRRIGDLEFFSDKMIEKVFAKNDNPRAFLRNCENVCRIAYDAESDKVKDEHLRML